MTRRTSRASKSRQRSAKQRPRVRRRTVRRVWPRGGVPSVDDLIRDELWSAVKAARAKNPPKAAAALRSLLRLADRLDLLRLLNAHKQSGRPEGPTVGLDPLAWLVWVARHYRIPFSKIENV